MWRFPRVRRFKLHKTQEDVDQALASVVRSAVGSTPFYDRLLSEQGVSVESIRGAADLARLPILERQRLVIHTPLRERLARSADPTKCVSRLTSGSSGIPVRVLLSRHEALYRKLLLLQAWRHAGSLHLPFTVIDVGVRPDLHSKVDVRWHGPVRVVQIPLSVLGDVDCRRLGEYRHAVLSGYPSSLLSLAERLEDENVSLSLRLVASRGELLHEETRRYLERTYNQRVADFYNCEEIGNVAWQCPADPGRLHVNSDACVVEVVDHAGNSLPMGREGRILVTNLYNYTMPFIRYDLQDRGVLLSAPGERCACGSAQPAIGVIQGRDDDFLIRTDGTRISPRLVATSLEHAADIALLTSIEDLPLHGYRVVQDALDHVMIRAVACQDVREPLEASIRDAFRRLEHRWICDLEWVDDIPPAPSGKIRKIIRECELPRRNG